MKENKLLHNAKWIIVCKTLQSLIQLAVGMLSARYLGPSNYGLLNYAAAVAAVALPFVQLGLHEILVGEYVENPDREGEILGTALVMNMASALCCIAGVTVFASAANPGEPVTILVCALYSTGLLFQAMEMVQYWFQAKLLSKYASLAMLIAYVAVSAYKILLLATGKSVCWFALAHGVEYGAAGFLLLAAYKKKGTQKLSFSAAAARQMFSKGKYYIASSLLVVAFQSTAGILVKLLTGTVENGCFAAAVTCTAVVQFVYHAIIDSARPVILADKKADQNQFEKHISGLYCVIVYLSLGQSVVFTVFAGPIMKLLYGAAYDAGIPVLRILIWQTAFSYMGTVRNIWILAQERYDRLWVINLCGALTNLALNLWFIPVWGACGAAAASLLTQIITNFVLGFLMKDIRPNNRLLLAGLHPRFAWRMLQNLTQTVIRVYITKTGRILRKR